MQQFGSLRGQSGSSMQLALPSAATAWPAQLRHVQQHRCSRQGSGRGGVLQQRASNVFAEGGDEQQQRVSPVNYAPKDRKQLWKAAIKLPMYSVGVVPVLVSVPGWWW